MVLELIGCGVLFTVLLAAMSLLAATVTVGISPMPSSAKARAALLSLTPTDQGPIAELGAGFGGVAIALAKSRPAQHIVAFETSPVPFLVLSLRARRYPNLHVRRANFLSADLRPFRVLVCYLFTGGMQALAQKLEREPHDVVLVTNTFLLRGHTPDVEVTLDDLYRTKVARYTLPQTHGTGQRDTKPV